MTRYGSQMVTYWVNAFTANAPVLQLENVFEGDQTLIPSVPTLCVMQGMSERSLVGDPRRVDQVQTIYAIIYHASLNTSIQSTEHDANVLAETVAKFMDDDSNLGGLCIHSFVTEIEPGWKDVGATRYRTTRITWQGLSRINLNTDP